MPIQRVARNLRRRETDAERKLWHALKNRQLHGWKFRRQHPVAGFVADLACPEAKLIVELDGGQHSEAIAADDARTARLEAEGWRMTRFWNYQIFEDLEAVLTVIAAELEKAR